MGSGMFVMRDGQLVGLAEHPYDSENFLQELLARYPDLLAGEQMDPAVPRRWLLVSREVPVAADDSGVGRWSLDHLFLDQDGIPTLVEVKRSSDTRARREVVAQMLDYTANAVKFWSAATIRSIFEGRCRGEKLDANQEVSDNLGENDFEAFWLRVQHNLNDRSLRLVFVADVIPPELLCIVEFLNSQMGRIEVLALEIPQFTGENVCALVPRVLGKTSETTQKSSSARRTRMWDARSLLEELENGKGSKAAEAAGRILDWAHRHQLDITWGKGPTVGEFSAGVVVASKRYALITPWTDGNATIEFGSLQRLPPFISESKRLELLRRINEAAGLALPPGVISKYPSVPLIKLEDPEALARFLTTLDWMLDELRQAQFVADNEG